jgi:hypothetical protein
MLKEAKHLLFLIENKPSRSFAEFTLSGRARFFASLRMTAKGSG